LHKFEYDAMSLLWDSVKERDFIFVALMDCHYVYGGIQIIDLKSKDIILTAIGDSLQKIERTDCYQIYCYGKPIEKGRQRICLEELLDIKTPDSSNVIFQTGWGVSDVYISTQREPVLKIGDLPKLAENLGKKFGEFVKNRYFHISDVVFSAQYNTIAFIGAGGRSFGFFDLGEKKLILFDYSDSLGYASPTWSPGGSRLALLKRSSSGEYIDFYELRGEGKIDLIKTYELIAEIPVSGFRWSDDSETFYFSYLGSNNQWVEKQIDLSR
jgi:hypothetical protein